GGKVEGWTSKRAGRGLGKNDLVLVQIAECDDARQDSSVAVEIVEEDVSRRPSGAPRRQIKRRLCQRQRIAFGREARHERAVAQRADPRRPAWARSGDAQKL